MLDRNQLIHHGTANEGFGRGIGNNLPNRKQVHQTLARGAEPDCGSALCHFFGHLCQNQPITFIQSGQHCDEPPLKSIGFVAE